MSKYSTYSSRKSTTPPSLSSTGRMKKAERANHNSWMSGTDRPATTGSPMSRSATSINLKQDRPGSPIKFQETLRQSIPCARTGTVLKSVERRIKKSASKHLPMVEYPPSTYPQCAHIVKREVSMKQRNRLEGEVADHTGYWGNHNNPLFPYPEAQTPSEIPFDDPCRQSGLKPVYGKQLVADGWNPSTQSGRDNPYWSATCPVGGGYRDVKGVKCLR
jgi:hypothetical protein